MAGPTVNVTLSVVDNVTGKLQEIKALSRRLNQNIAPNLGLGKANGEINEMKGGLQSLGAIAKTAGSIVGGAFALMAAAVVKHAFTMNNQIADLQNRMEAFSGVSKEAAENMRKLGAVQFAGYKGGQKGAMEAANAAAQAGVPEAALPGVTKTALMYADVMQTEPKEAAEKLVQATMMNNRFKDDKGNTISIDKATPAQINKGIRDEAGHQFALNQILPGKATDTLDFEKMAGPEFHALGLPESQMDGFQYFMAQGGFTGSHAGTYARGVASRAAKPSLKSYALDKQYGIDTFSHLDMNKDAMTPDNVVAGLEAKWGTFDEKTRAKVRGHAADYQAGKIDASKLDTSLVDTVKDSGAKGTQNDAAVSKGVFGMMTGFVKSVDILGQMKEAQDKGVGAGWWTGRYGLEAGTGAMTAAQHMSPEGWDKVNHLGDKPYSEQFDDAEAKRKEGVSFQTKRFEDLIDGIQTTMAHLAEPSLVSGLQSLNAALESFSGNITTYAEGIKQIGEALAPVGKLIYSTLIQPGLDMIEMIGKLATAIANMLETIRPYAEALGLMKKKDKKPLPGEPGGPEGPPAPKTIWPTLTDAAGTVGNVVTTVQDAKKKAYDTVAHWVTEAADAATQGNPDSPNARRGTTGNMRRNMREGELIDESAGLNMTPANSGTTTVIGTVEGQATVNTNITVEPSSWFTTKIANIESAIVSLKGSIGGDKTGVNMPGSNGAKPAYTGTAW